MIFNFLELLAWNTQSINLAWFSHSLFEDDWSVSHKTHTMRHKNKKIIWTLLFKTTKGNITRNITRNTTRNNNSTQTTVLILTPTQLHSFSIFSIFPTFVTFFRSFFQLESTNKSNDIISRFFATLVDFRIMNARSQKHHFLLFLAVISAVIFESLYVKLQGIVACCTLSIRSTYVDHSTFGTETCLAMCHNILARS